MLKNYIQIAVRNLGINKSYFLLNIFGLSMGMSGAILIFLFLQFHLKTDRHQPDFDRIYRVVLDMMLDEGTEPGTGSSVPMAASLAQDYSQIEQVGFIKKLPDATLSSVQGKGMKRFIEKGNIVFANQGFMDMFAFSWLEKSGREFMKEPFQIVLSQKQAEKYFGTKNAVGQILRLNNKIDLKVAGIIKNNEFPTDLNYEFYISLPTLKKFDPLYEMDNFSWLSVRNETYIKLKNAEQAAQTEKQIKANGNKYYGETAKYYKHKLQPFSQVHFDEKYDGKIRFSILGILAGVGVFLLLIACINFVNLATAQALKRSREIGVRKVLGGTRSQLFWQFMLETAILTFSAALLALIFSALFLPLLNDWTNTKSFHLQVLFQPELLLFWLLAVVVVILAAGFYPAVIISGFNPIIALKNKIGLQQSGGIGLRRSLIAVQLIIAQILVIGTIVLILQMNFFRNTDPGFDQHAVITIPLPASDSTQQIRSALKNNLLQYAEIKSVSYQYEAPMSTMGYGGSVRFDNRVDWEKFMISDRFGDESYLDTYRIPLLAGRNLMIRDSITEFIVNEEFMQKTGIRIPEQLIGRQLLDGNSGLEGKIVGVVKSFHLKSLQEAVQPCAIFNYPKLYKEVAIRLDTKDFSKSVQNIQNIWQKLYPEEVFTYQFVDKKIAEFYDKEDQLATLIRSFAMTAILICCLGLYGMVSFMVTQKMKEIGVRKVLGAGISNIMLLFGREFFILVTAAFFIAAPIAWMVMNNWLNGFAYRIAFHWWILALGGIVILSVTFITVGFKVMKAALMNPVKSLKAD